MEHKYSLTAQESEMVNQQQQLLAIRRQCDLQQQIRLLIHKDNQAQVEFFYENDDDGYIFLTVVTVNPVHREMFTLHQTDGYSSQIECLDEVLAYLQSVRQQSSGYIPYEVVWYKKSESGTNKSTFYVKNLQELSDKFFENKNPDDYVIRKIEMLPVS